MTPVLAWVIVLAAGFAGGAANALAGGGQFLIFPALLLAGIAPVKADATASLVVLPGVLASTWVYRSTLPKVGWPLITKLLIATAFGSALGSVLLLLTPDATFSRFVPWLLLLAAVIFSFASRTVRSPLAPGAHQPLLGLLAGQFAIMVYGGYFGAGMGILLISLYLLTTPFDVQTSKGIRTLTPALANLITVGLFAAHGAIDFRTGVPMMAACVAGGYTGAHAVTLLREGTVRRVILIYAWLITAWFFVRTFA